MKGRSLKLRLLIAGAVTVAIALAITGVGLTYLFERHVERRIGSELDTYISQIASRISFDNSRKLQLDGRLADPRFENIYGGLYWQVNNESSGQSVRSRSLWDIKLVLPIDTPGFGQVQVHTTKGPLESALLVHERRLRFNSPQGEQIMRLIVAIDLAELQRLSREFASDVAIALFVLCVVLLLAGWIQVTIGLGPLSLIQQSISAIRSGKTTRMEHDMPSEVSPLAHEVNNLLQAQEAAIDSARHRARDLAHTFKTPLTALKTDIKRLRDKGECEIASDIENISNVMRRQIERELTKARVRNVRKMKAIKIQPVIDAVISTLQRTPDGEGKKFRVMCDRELEVHVDKDDLTEILGNLIENAVKHATDEILVNVEAKPESIEFKIADDGEGISCSFRNIATKRGVRLDQSHAGTGLGLAIVKDILDAYDQELKLDRSSMGGLSVRFKLARSSAKEYSHLAKNLNGKNL